MNNETKREGYIVYLIIAVIEIVGLVLTGVTHNGWCFGGALILVAVGFVAWFVYSIKKED